MGIILMTNTKMEKCCRTIIIKSNNYVIVYLLIENDFAADTGSACLAR